MFVGTEAVCNDLLEKLRAGTLRYDDFRIMLAARVSHYTTRDGKELVALADENDKVYLGKRDHYDHCGHYLNNDDSLLHISDNAKMFDFVSGGGFPDTQDELLDSGYFTHLDYAEFAALQTGIPGERGYCFLFMGRHWRAVITPLAPF